VIILLRIFSYHVIIWHQEVSSSAKQKLLTRKQVDGRICFR